MPTITLTNGNDTYNDALVVPDPTVDTIFALDGDDTIMSSQGDDVIYGGNGNDSISSNFAVLTPDVGGDTVYGGAGDDIINTLGPVTDTNGSIVGFTSSSVGDTVYGGDGNDSILGAVDVDDPTATDPTQDDDFLFGGAGNDIIDGNGGEDFIDAGDGNDLVFAGEELSTIEGGTGTDTVTFVNLGGPVTFDMATGAATVTAGVQTITGFENAIGTGAGDTIVGNATGNVITGGGGNDSLSGAGGSDTFIAGAGDDTVVGGEDAGNTDIDVYDFSSVATGITVTYTATEAGTVTGTGTGTDTFSEIERFVFTNAADAVNAAADLNGVTLSMLGGDDFVRASQGPDSLDGGAGTDELSYVDSAAPVTLNIATGTGTGGNAQGDSFTNFERFTLTSGADSVIGSANADSVDGGAGDDTLDGGGGNDTLFGGIGNDTIRGGAGADSMSGGAGTDTLDYSGSAAGVTVNLANQSASGGDATGDTFSSFEGVIGSSQGDTLTGSAAANTIDGGAGNDSILGGGGNDSIIAGLGDDTVQGGPGNDSMDGGDGFDTLDYSEAAAPVSVDLGAGTATGGGGSDTFVNFEGATGTTGNDTLIGNAAGNALDGGAGADSIDGGDGDDTLTGGAGGDSFAGDAGNDTLFGGDDADLFTVSGTSGDDTIVGGEGGTDSDTISVTAPAGGRFDVIYGGGNNESGTIIVLDNLGNTVSTVTFSEVENVVCFTRGTMIDTPDGARAIEELEAGDLVVTRDHGARPIRWIGSQAVRATGKMAPVMIRKGALGNDRDLMVSQLHRMLITDWRAELMFGEPEVLACAKHLVNGDTIHLVEGADGGEVEYFHMLFDRHEIVTANGAPSESFHPGEQGMGWMDDAVRDEIFSIFPQLRTGFDGFGPSARASLKAYEARALIR